MMSANPVIDCWCFVVFQGGKLTYIDYDTKDVTFNKMVPAAYQVCCLCLSFCVACSFADKLCCCKVMSMLMNYQRTISDFGHCDGNSRLVIGARPICLLHVCVGNVSV